MLSETGGDPLPAAPLPPSPFERLHVRGIVLQLVIAVAGVLAILHAAFPVLRRPENSVIHMIVAYVVMLMVLLIRGQWAHLSWSRLLGPAPRASQLPLLGVVVPLGLMTAASLVLIFVPLSYLAPELVQHTVLDPSPLDHVTSTSQFLLLFATIAIVAPIVEELLFRGFFLHRLAHRWGTGAGVIISSALFAVGHVEWIGHFVTGIVFALIYLRTRSLWMSMLAHGVYNAMFAVSIGWSFFTHEAPEVETLAGFRSGLPGGVLTLAAGVLLFWMYVDLYWKTEPIGEVMGGGVPYDG